MHPSQPIEASVDALAWLSGRWVGADGPNRLEEVWTAPEAGMLLGMFRWLRDGAPRFYELMSVEPEVTGLVFRIKHFDPGLKGWEEKDDAVTLDLVACSEDGAVFLKRGERRWMVYRREAETGELLCWFETEASPHAAGDEFHYSRG